MYDAAINFCQLRFAVALLGQRSEQNWWDAEFLTRTGLQLLAYNFSRQPLLAAFSATCQAAKRVHDERIGRRATYHLFRLPAETEVEVHRLASEQGARRLLESPMERDGAIQVLRRFATQEVDAPEGPVPVADIRDVHSPLAVEELAKHYLSGFTRGTMTLPYFTASRK